MTVQEKQDEVLQRTIPGKTGTIKLERGMSGALHAALPDGSKLQLTEPRELDPRFDKPWLDMLKKQNLSPADYRQINGKLFLRATAEQMGKALSDYRGAEEEAIKTHVPGLEELRSARQQEADYDDRFRRMMSSEHNDGASAPKKPALSSTELERRYPRAAMYLEAMGHMDSANTDKIAAGKKAKEMLLNGEPEEAVRKILDNWTSPAAQWN